MVKIQEVINKMIEKRKKTSQLEWKHVQMKSQLTKLGSLIDEKVKQIIKLTQECLALSIGENSKHK